MASSKYEVELGELDSHLADFISQAGESTLKGTYNDMYILIRDLAAGLDAISCLISPYHFVKGSLAMNSLKDTLDNSENFKTYFSENYVQILRLKSFFHQEPQSFSQNQPNSYNSFFQESQSSSQEQRSDPCAEFYKKIEESLKSAQELIAWADCPNIKGSPTVTRR